MINDEQRLALIELLKAADLRFTTGPRCGGGAVEEAPLEYWIDMLQELPDDDDGVIYESKHRMIHGFCL